MRAQKTAKKGRVMYVPPVVIDEVSDIRRENLIPERCDAFREMVKYARVGREAQRLLKLDFSRAVPRIPVDEYPKRKWKKKKVKKDIFDGGIL